MRAVCLSAWQLFLAWVVSAALVSFAMVVVLLTLGRTADSFGRFVVRLWGRTMLRIVRVKLEVSGEHHLDGRSARVVVFNHASLLDLFVATALLPQGGVAAVKRELLYYPFLGWAVWMFGFIIIDRKCPQRAHKSLAQAAERIRKEKITVFISPEGTRTQDGNLLPFKPGALHLARAANVPVIALAIHGCFDLMPNGRLYSDPGVVRVEVLGPQPLAHVGEVREAANALHGVVAQALAGVRRNEPEVVLGNAAMGVL